MYRFLARLTPDDVEAIAAQLYVECLLHGYTSVAEFHYLHNAPDGSRYADPAELAHRIVAAAQHRRHRPDPVACAVLPLAVRRRAADRGAAPLRALGSTTTRTCARQWHAAYAIGIAPHSLRAVTPDGTRRRHRHRRRQADPYPRRRTGEGSRRLPRLERRAPGRLAARSRAGRSSLVPGACDAYGCCGTPRLASSSAVAGLCQTTEANLGDGIFPLREFLAEGGRFGIGSDSNVCTSPVEELRWLEYIRRLETRTRNVTETRPGASVALNLYQRALAGGVQALGRNAGAIAPGRPADLVVLDTEHPALLGRSGDGVLDAWLFSGNSTPVRDVMVAGNWVVRDGRHHAQQAIAAAFARTMRRLAEKF